jgi:hypothetical protein
MAYDISHAFFCRAAAKVCRDARNLNKPTCLPFSKPLSVREWFNQELLRDDKQLAISVLD